MGHRTYNVQGGRGLVVESNVLFCYLENNKSMLMR